LLGARLRVVFVVEVENRALIILAAFNLTISLVAAVHAIIHAVAVPLVRNALLVRDAFELVVVAELALALVLPARAIADVIASNGVEEKVF
jgi:hypothetical protein